MSNQNQENIHENNSENHLKNDKKDNILKNYSYQLLVSNPEIKKTRKICYIQDIFQNKTDFDELQNLSNYTFNKLNIDINLINKDVVYSMKTNVQGNYMKWHCDDGLIINHKSSLISKTENQENQIKISDKKCLYYPNKIPKYSLIIYGSTYKKDFTGGIFEFSDGIKIKPERNLCVFFDSKEAHCIHRIREGVKKLILIKFY